MQNPAKALRILLLAAALSGCSKKPAPQVWYLERIAVSEKPLSGGAVEISAAELRQSLLEALAANQRFVVLEAGAKPPAGAATLKCQLDVAFTRDEPAPEGKGARSVEAGVVLQLRQGTDRRETTGVGRSRFTGTDLAARAEAHRDAVTRAVAASVEMMALDLTARDRSDAELIADLDAEDARVRDFAVRTLADRKNAAAVPALIERLRDPDREVALRSVGALRAIGDPRAVGPLIDLTRNRDPAFVTMVMDVVASIGGDEAEAYLFTLASGHPDESVRAAAEQAGKDLKERAERRRQTAERARQNEEKP